MKKYILLLILSIGFIGYSFLAKNTRITKFHNDGISNALNSVNPPGERTGAPGEGVCTNCHLGATMSWDGVFDVTLSGGPNYTPGMTYPITVSTVGGPKNGFQLTIFDASNEQVGTFTAGSNSSVVTFGGKQYIRHSASVGQTSWTFDWTAPADDLGGLTAYFAMNKSNNNGSAFGDEIFIGNIPIPSEFSSLSENEIEKSYNVFFNASARELNLKYTLTDNAKVVLNIQDMSGKLVQYYDMGNRSAGNYSEQLTVDKIQHKDVYIVSLFIGNNVFNRKLILE